MNPYPVRMSALMLKPRYASMARILLFLPLCFLFVGCASNWEQSFEPRAESSGLESSAAVVVREVPWERLERTLEDLSRLRAERDIAWEEWPESQKQEADAMLLRALQVSQPSAEIEILGRSSFKTTDRMHPGDGSLERFARKIGADYAIWSRRYLGKADRVVREPVQESGYRQIRYYDRKSKRYRTRYDYEYWTTYVPMVVKADESAWVVYYLRRR